MLTLKLLGTPGIEASNGPVTSRATQGRRLALLALLASARGRPATRDKLLALIWPESSTERARHQLSDDLYILRTTLGADVVRSRGDELWLNPVAITSDVEMFERLLDEGCHEAAVELCTGALLDGFHLRGSVAFEHWLDAERARLGHRYATALEALAERSEARNEIGSAVSWWRRLTAHDPFNGRVTLRLMRVLEASGNRADALKHARKHERLLREEFDAEPDPQVTSFAARLRLGPPTRLTPEPTLACIQGLRVAARTSTFALRHVRLDVRTNGDILDAPSVLELCVARNQSSPTEEEQVPQALATAGGLAPYSR